ncbi:MAG: hypothetical protein KAI29_03685 [Cyclobacteriaceae bacterium]|nr:hypothetical protein [Cyclobacteriaceae bacterium]
MNYKVLIKKPAFFLALGAITVLSYNCNPKPKEEKIALPEKGTFAYDLNFLSKHQETILLKDGEAQLLVCPAYQGRVMTSTSNGNSGLSYGWLNYELIGSGKTVDKINAVGGEDRFWLGPEGGQFSIFFKKGDQFNLDTWQTPAVIDTETYDLVSKTEKSAVFEKEFTLENYSGNEFSLKVDRAISLLSTAELQDVLSMEIPDKLNAVAYRSSNTITNTGESKWTKETGALSIWILGMFNPSPSTTILIPFKKGPETELGQIVNDTYFGKVPADRLIVNDGILYFKGDGQYRSKIGLNPKRALPLMGSYDEENKLLTIVHYSKPEGVTDYVNSMWELQDEPFAGDAANSYNDGPVDGNALGPFYELESSSPAVFLESGQSMEHNHTTIHIRGDEKELDVIVQKVFGITLEEIMNAF